MSGLRIAGASQLGSFRVEVDVHLEPGETLAVLGPNGAGKSTLLRTICGLLPLESGALELDGRTLDDPASGVFVPPAERSIGVVFQDLLLFPDLNVIDNVAFGLRARGMARRAARGVAADWLARVGLAHLGDVGVAQLSGGEAQRVALARALAPAPRVLLLDEPLSALDADVRGRVRRQLRDHLALHDGPRILVTHDALDAAVLADRVIVLEQGLVTDSGLLADLVARPRTAWSAELAGTNLLPATAEGARLHLRSGGVLVAAERAMTAEVLVAIRPASVTLHRGQPESSARNVWQATVAEVEGFGERYRVRLEGMVPLVAEVTGGAIADLGVCVGEPVWASVKATDVQAYPV